MATTNALVLKKDFLAVLNAITPAVMKKASLPILQTVRISGMDGGRAITVSATNLEFFIRRDVDASISGELDACFDFALLKSIVASGPDVIELTPTSVAGATVKTMSPDDFPVFPIGPYSEPATISGGALTELLNRVAPFAAGDASRPVLAAISLKTTDNQLEAAAADGFRLAVSRMEWSGPALSILVPARAAKAFAAQKLTREVTVQVSQYGSQVLIGAHGVTFLSRLIEGQFPDYAQIIPKNRPVRSTVQANALADAVKGLRPFAKDNNDIVRLHVNGALAISAKSDDLGSREFVVPTTEASGPEETFALNATYLAAVCANAKGRALEIGKAEGRMSPVRFDDGLVTSVVMPMVIAD